MVRAGQQLSRLLQPWAPVAADGSAVYGGRRRPYRMLPSRPDTLTCIVRCGGRTPGRRNMSACPVSPPESGRLICSSGSDGKRALWRTYNALIDPSDHDPTSPSLADTRYQDFYITGADGSIVHVNRDPTGTPANSEQPFLIGASKDLSKVMFTSNRKLVSEAPPSDATSVYWTDGRTTKLVSEDENGTPFDAGGVGLSDDGSTAVFRHRTPAGRCCTCGRRSLVSRCKVLGPLFPKPLLAEISD